MRKELIAYRDPKSPTSEIFRTLRTNIQFMNNRKLQTLVVTSTLPGEGKSFISSNLAITFAQMGKRTLIVDADMRKGRMYSIFSVSQIPGLSNYLSGIDESGEITDKNITGYVQETAIDNLYVISAGNIPPNPAELLVSDKMLDGLDYLKNIFDIIIFDTPPSLLVTDSAIISRIVDTTIIVSEYNQTKKEDLEKVKKDIENVGGKIGGVVVNKIPVSVKKYNEAYYYSKTSLKSNEVKKAKRMEEIEKIVREEKMKKQREETKEILENTNVDNYNENNTNQNSNSNAISAKTEEILRQINNYNNNNNN